MEGGEPLVALGDAFITIRADVSKFKTELAAALQGALADAEKTRIAPSAGTASGAVAAQAKAAAAEATAAAEDGEAEVTQITAAEAAKRAVLRKAETQAYIEDFQRELGMFTETQARVTGVLAAESKAREAIIRAEAAAYAEAAKREAAIAAAGQQRITGITAAQSKAREAIIRAESAAYAEAAKREAAETAAGQQRITGITTAESRARTAIINAESAAYAEAAKREAAEVAAGQQRITGITEAESRARVAIINAETAAYAEAAKREAAEVAAGQQRITGITAAESRARVAIINAESAAYAEAAKRAADATRLQSAAVSKAAKDEASLNSQRVKAQVAAAKKPLQTAFRNAVFDTGATDAELANLETHITRVKSALSSVGGAAGNAFDVVATAAKFTTIGVIALGGALAAVGLSAGAQLQNAKIAFASLAGEIRGGTKATEEFTAAQQKAIGDKFTQDLRDLALQSSLTFSSLQSVSQQLLSLGFSGEATKSAIIDVGNALAASGKTGGQLNDDLRGIFVAFSQIKGAGRLLAQDLNQITTRVPAVTRVKVYDQLARDLKVAGANANSTSASLGKARLEIQKMEKQGKISADVALKALDEVFKKVAGAGPDAFGQNALQRTNLSLAGQFEQFKETIRNSLADIFDEKFTNALGKKIGNFLPVVKKALSDAGPTLRAFVTTFIDLIGNLIVPLAQTITTVFTTLGIVLEKIAPKLPAIVAGFASIFTVINNIAQSDVGARIGETFAAIGDAIPPIVDGFKAAAPAFAVVAAAALDLIDIVLVLAPAVKGLGEVLGAIGIILSPLVALLDLVKAAFNIIPPGVIEAIGAVVAALAAFVGIVTVVSIIGPAVAGALAAITLGVEALTIALLANPIGLTIAAVAVLGIALVLLARKFEPVRIALTTGLELIARTFTIQVDVILLAIQGLLKAFDSVGGFLGKVIPGLGGIADKAGAAADKIGDLRHELDGAVGSISELGAKSTNTFNAAATNVAIFNKTLGLTGNQALSAAADTVELNAAIDALPTEKQIAIRVQIEESIVKSNADFFASHPNIKDPGGEGFGFDPATFNAANKKSATDATDALQKQLDGILKGAAGGGGSGGGGSAAGTKAKNAFADRIRTIIQGLDQEFKTGLIAGDAANARKTLNKLARSIIDAFADNKKPRPSALLDRLHRENVRLQKLIAERDSIVKRLKDAADATQKAVDDVGSFASITGAFDELSKSVDGAAGSLADLSRLKIIRPGQDTIGGLSIQASAAQASGVQLDTILKNRLKAIQDFQADLAAIIKRGVNRDLVQQIVDAGVSGGAATADALANASDATIKSINSTQKQIDAAAKALGSTAGDVAASVGEGVVTGIVTQLKKQKGALVDAITELVDVIVKRLKKGLGIKSPSTVTGFIGRMTGRGLINSLHAAVPHVERAAQRMADAAIPNLDAITLPPVLAPNLDAISLPDLAQRGGREARAQLDVALSDHRSNADAERRHRELVGAVRDGHAKPETHRTITPTPPPVLPRTFAPSAAGVMAKTLARI